MGGEVEKYLLDKLDQAIKDTESTEHCLSTKLFGLHSDFKKLQGLLQPNARTTRAIDELKRRENLYYLNIVLTEWQLISKRQSFYTPEALSFAYKLSQKLKKIKKDLKGGANSVSGAAEISGTETSTATITATAQDNEGSRNLATNFDTYRWSSRTVDRTKVHGLDDKERFLERLLVRKESKDGFRAIAIVGMLGVGKTTLCQVIFNNQKVKDHFLPRIWVCMSRQPEDDKNHEKEIVKRMLMCLGMEDDIIEAAGEDPNLGLQRLMFALRLQLVGKKYLIVLDDAWNSENEHFEDLGSQPTPQGQEESWYAKLAYGLPKGSGGTVIVTSRSEEIAKKMVGEENLHHLPPVKDRESCWQIFIDSVEKDGKKFPPNLKELKNMIVDKCAGLPLAAKMMGEIMNQKIVATSNPVASGNQQSQNHRSNHSSP